MSDKLTATCPSCKDVALLAERIMVCDRCEAIYHDACWKKNGNRCIDPECVAASPPMPPVEVRSGPPEPPPRPGPRKGLPSRVQSGTITDEGMTINNRLIPWESVEMLGLGIIELDLTVEVPRSAMRAMLRKLMGDDAQPNHQRRSIRESYLLDIFVKETEAPWRFDSSAVNYRSLLGDASHQSMRNFMRLLKTIAGHTPNARLDSSAAALLSGRRLEVKRYTSIYEFEMEAHIWRNRLSELVLCSSIDSPAGEMGSEWSDTETVDASSPAVPADPESGAS